MFTNFRLLAFPAHLLCLGALLVTLAPAPAATDDVWVRTVLHEDGTRTTETKDLNTRTIEAKTFDEANQLQMKRIIQLDPKGKFQRGFIYDGNNNLVFRMTYIYDEIDRLVESLLYNMAGDLVSRQVQKYDATGGPLRPIVMSYGSGDVRAGQIRPAAALAAPGSSEPAIQKPQTATAPATAGGAKPPKPEKKGIFGGLFKKKKK